MYTKVEYFLQWQSFFYGFTFYHGRESVKKAPTPKEQTGKCSQTMSKPL
jgi:hypothetical protein